ncbi:probable inactive peptidyl-prolyl cis-trans isomerase-like 6 [Dendronephthya gigantea]|uniref:probable inactive peptidyl-prolyl cis-trans isomerase-like 6 n=1 Tax=Dendronephthya gigantea TaxID=151771 RepID=UPI00106A6F00|nr:probable inactive peptidyl-prolyl cis-trans isomerase-like 6 [Dendronephthya gigantea]
MVAKKLLSIYGLLKNVEFHQASGIAEDLYNQNKDEFHPPICKGMLEYEWVAFIENKRQSIGGELWSFSAEVLICEDNSMIGDFEIFKKWIEANYQLSDYRPLPLWHAMAKEKYKTHLLESKHNFVFLDIQVSSESIGRLLIELYSDKCPKTCSNFLELCHGALVADEKADTTKKLTYKQSIFHRIVPNGWIQGGDFITQKGIGGQSIYGALFEDENFSVPHNKRGIVGMANKGRHTNSSQFYITLQPTPWMDTKYVAFGQVIEGMDVLKTLEEQETYNERPKQTCMIVNCGIFDVEKLWS